jgi:hypothetical protein
LITAVGKLGSEQKELVELRREVANGEAGMLDTPMLDAVVAKQLGFIKP